jgi:hypothetical protein
MKQITFFKIERRIIMSKIYVVKTYCDDEFYEHEIVDICDSEEEAARYGEGFQGSGHNWIDVYNEEEFNDEFNESERAEMLEEYSG